MTIKHPEWHPQRLPEFDARMAVESAALLQQLRTDSVYRRACLDDPRLLHRRLYAPFAPPTHPEYAGAYRGDPGTSLALRIMGGPSVYLKARRSTSWSRQPSPRPWRGSSRRFASG